MPFNTLIGLKGTKRKILKQLIRIFILITILPVWSISQLSDEEELKIDSLKKVIEYAKHDTTIVSAMSEWDNIIYISDAKLDLELNLKIDSLCTLNLSKKLSNKEKLAFYNSQSAALTNLGIAYGYEGDYDKAIHYHSKSLVISARLKEKERIAATHNNLGIIYFEKGNYAKAIDNYGKCLTISKELGNENVVGTVLNNIGIIHAKQGDTLMALEHYSESIEIQKRLEDDAAISRGLSNMGSIYFGQKNYEKALEYDFESLRIREKIGDEKGMASNINNISLVYHGQKNYSEALTYSFRSLELREKLGDRRGIAQSFESLGLIFESKGELSKALDYQSKALRLGQEIGAASIIKNSSEALWGIHKKRKNFKQALEMHELYTQSKDSLNSERNQKEVIRHQYKYEYEMQSIADSLKTVEQTKVQNALITAQKSENKRQRLQSYVLYGGLAVALLFGGFIYNRFRMTHKQNRIIENQKEEMGVTLEKLAEKNQEVMDSIIYAKRIQSAILPSDKIIKESLKESFVLYKPKDIVAGDFYWLDNRDGNVLFAVADCTGHGVPGAMVSVVCNNALNRSVLEYNLTNPGAILNKTRDIVIAEFEKSEEDVKDGMDIALCALKGDILTYAGANNPLWLIRKDANEIVEIKANKQPIGKFDNPVPYTAHEVQLFAGDSFYLFSDGYVDQFGGLKNKKFKVRAFRALLLSIQDQTMTQQKATIDEAFENWRGEIEQIDDVCIIGVKYA